ncbi:MAG: hypothetical protein HZA93_27365 [Verrucomicrobia bacterium]|nr:hypothetical protein [Verrucomicrobiota bacterium]
MSSAAPLPHPAVRAGLFRTAPVLALWVTTALSASAARPTFDGGKPPAFPDEHHVLNGCYISTGAFITRFLADHPAERACPLTVDVPGFHGLHTIALLSWRGDWWGRDEYCGVFPLSRDVAANPEPAALRRRAEDALGRHARNEVRAGRAVRAPAPPRTLPVAERAQMISTAAAALPFASEVFWVAGGRDEFPVLFFRPAPDQVAVYEPITGTSRAECKSSDHAGIVRLIAERLGYRVDAVRADFTAPAGALVASAGAARRELAR